MNIASETTDKTFNLNETCAFNVVWGFSRQLFYVVR